MPDRLKELTHECIRRSIGHMIRQASRAAAARVYWMNRARLYRKTNATDMVELCVRFARDNNRVILRVKRDIAKVPL